MVAVAVVVAVVAVVAVVGVVAVVVVVTVVAAAAVAAVAVVVAAVVVVVAVAVIIIVIVAAAVEAPAAAAAGGTATIANTAAEWHRCFSPALLVQALAHVVWGGLTSGNLGRRPKKHPNPGRLMISVPVPRGTPGIEVFTGSTGPR